MKAIKNNPSKGKIIESMKYLSFMFLLFLSCKTHPKKEYLLYEYNKRAESYIYNSKYKKQDIMVNNAINSEEQALKIAEAYLAINDKCLNVKYYSKNCKLVNNNIWKVMFIRKEKNGEIKADVYYFIYLRAKDGALLYQRRLTPKNYSAKHPPKIDNTED